MKGLMDVLQRTGFVRVAAGSEPEDSPDGKGLPSPRQDAPQVVAPNALPELGPAAFDLAGIYADAGIRPGPFSAEKLLRLLEGLKVMDEATRKMAVQAMDAADDGWSIADPIQDAMDKVQALEGYGQSLKAAMQLAEQKSADQLQRLREAQEHTVADIRRQIADLEGLLAREIARSAQEQAQAQAILQGKRDAAARQLEQAGVQTAELRRLIAQFGAA